MNVGLVLSGGFAKGAYQIGALKAISEFLSIDDIKCMSCASIGVLNGYSYFTGKLDKAEHMWRNICGDEERFLISQILRSQLLRYNIISICNNADIPGIFYCTLLNLKTRSVFYKDLSKVNKGNIEKHLKASVSLPIYSKGIRIDDTLYFDGATVDNIPVYPLLNHDLDYIICIYFDDVCYRFENNNFDNKIIKIVFPGKSILKESFVISQQNIEDMIKCGYEKTKMVLQVVFQNGKEDIDYISKTIAAGNSCSKKESIRITADVAFTNVNKLTRKIIRKKAF
ncbi:MAG: patatin-like phospholipase family protein [Clostridia bacterium]|nr:patatin-like phospholipase family protein [Clostridia bacterium]